MSQILFIHQLTCPHMSVNHCSQPIAFCALHKETCGVHRDKKTALNAEQQHGVGIAERTVTYGRRKSKGLVIAVVASVVPTHDTQGITVIFSCFSSLNESWRTAKAGSEHVVNLMIRP